MSSLFIISNIAIFDFIHLIVFDLLFLLRDSAYALYTIFEKYSLVNFIYVRIVWVGLEIAQ